MRSMKRALSLVLTMAMLLGMFLVPTNAAGTNFTDANLIENTEAVQITSGIGLFAGTTSGEFAPKATVTRAQMATIIVKMLRGSNFNADAFKGVGVNPFPDTAAFEGGWAEGYINACVQLGVVAGYGDGTFKPGKAVTTAEAMTMIINALGVDPGPGEWPLTYMAKAEAMKLYGDLAAKPATNNPLTRDQLAVIVWEGLKYSPSGSNGYAVTVGGKTFIVDNISDAVATAGEAGMNAITEVIGEDALANKIYEIKTASGWITGNTATGEDCTVLKLADGTEEYYGEDTGLDMLGHYVTVYYKEQFKNDEEPGEVYTILDESTVVTVKETISTSKKYKEAFGKSINVADTGYTFDSSYVASNVLSIGDYDAGTAAPKGTYIIADGVIVTYIAPATVYASFVSSINTAVGSEKVFIDGTGIPNTEGDDRVVEYAGMKSGDFITYVKVGDIYVLSPVEKVTGTVTKTSTTEVNGEDYDTITIAGTAYPAFEPKGTSPSNNNVGRKLENDLSQVQYGQSYTLYVTEDGHYIGFETADAAVSLDNTVYLLGNIVIKEKDNYGKTSFFNKVRGVDMEGKEVMLVIGKAKDVSGDGAYQVGEDADTLGSMDTVLEGFYNVKDSTDKDEKKEGIQVIEAYAAVYSPDSPSYVTKTYSAEPAFVGTNSITTMEGIATVGTSTTKYLFVSGGLNDSAPLTVTMQTGTISPAIALKTAEPENILVTRMGGAISNIEVFVRLTEDERLNTIYVYVTPEQLENEARTADGYAYTAYLCSTGKETEIIVGEDQTRISVPGFACLKEVDEGIYSATYCGINLRDVHQSSSEADISVAIANLGMVGVTGSGGNRLRFERMVGTENAIVINAAGKATTNAPGQAVSALSGATYLAHSAASVPVFDLRDEDEIAASGVDEILNMKQLTDLLAVDPGLMVVFDLAMYGQYRSYNCKAMFVKKIVRDTVGMNSVIYAEGFGSDSEGDYAIGFAASAINAVSGDEVKVYADRVVDAGPGFYRYCVDADGNIALVPYDKSVASVGKYGMFGIHETITGIEVIDASTLRMTTANADHSCSISCLDSAFEALKELYVTADTMIYDQTKGDYITLDELAALELDYKVNVELFCANGVYGSGVDAQKEKDDTVDILVVTGKANKYSSSCDGNHEGWTAIGAAQTIAESGNYYLDADINGKIIVDAGGAAVEVTLCMCGHSITNAGNAVEAEPGSNLTLINCIGRAGGNITSTGTGSNHGIQISDGGQATIKDGIYVVGCEGDAPVIINGVGVFNMYGGTISGNKAPSAFGGGVYMTNGTFNMDGGTITGCSAASGGGVYMTNGTFNMSGGTISSCTVTGNGGGVYMTNGTFNMSGDAKITACKAASGGGVYMEKGTFTMNGGTITGMTTTGGGGGVYVAGGTFNMSGDAAITSCTAASGGGVTVKGTFNMSGGTIADNTITGTANSNHSGGVFNQGTFNMSGDAAITGNKGGKYGGAVRNYSAGVFNMTGGTMTGNEASTGGAVYNDAATGEVKMSGGTITDNKATSGKDVYSAAGAKATEVSGDATVGEIMATGTVIVSGGTVSDVAGHSTMKAGKVITVSGGDIVNVTNDGKGDINVTGGNVTGALSNTSSGKLTITGGTFSSDPAAYVDAAAYTVTAAGGKYTVTAK